VLQTAVNRFKAQYESDGHRLEKAVKNILEKKLRLQKKYARPNLDTDRLYRIGVIYLLADKSTYAIACGNDPSKLILQSEQTEDENNPAVYYSLIVSANKLMKDALIRNKLAAEKNILCFEMEAAGLMNHFLCLMIREICDYSNLHKNKDWQEYAAMAAAAYAKDFFCLIAPNRIKAENKVSELFSSD